MNANSDFEEQTIASLFALSPESPAELSAGLDGDQFKEVVKEAKSLAQPVEWSAVRNDLASTMIGALDTKVIGCWASAWQKCAEVREKAEKSRNSPDTQVPCTLLEHSINSALQPYVEVYLGPKLIQKINFDVALETKIDGLILNMKGGSIVSLQIGQCEWSGSIAVQGVQLIKRNLTELDLPGRIVLKKPILVAVRHETVVTPSP
jgi:hypothetical protein